MSAHLPPEGELDASNTLESFGVVDKTALALPSPPSPAAAAAAATSSCRAEVPAEEEGDHSPPAPPPAFGGVWTMTASRGSMRDVRLIPERNQKLLIFARGV